MSTRSLFGQHSKRFSFGVNRRLTESLLSSGGIVATIGLMSAALTLVFVTWLVLELRQQSRVDAPLARSAAVMNASINQSLSSLRGWIAYGQPESRAERSRIWVQQIEPTLERLAQLGTQSRDDSVSGQIEELRDLLQELKLIQWAIEDVARTPGNRPATVAYETRLQPLRSNILRSLHSEIEYYSARKGEAAALALVTQLARFRSAFTQADMALSAYVSSADQAFSHTVLQQLARAAEQGKLIEVTAPEDTKGDILHLLEFGGEEFRAYRQQAQEIISLQQTSDWNVAQDLYVREAQPIVLRAVGIAGGLAESQALAMVEKSESLTRASYLVAGMALLMGLLSVGSLRLSVRLQQQVSSVLNAAKMLGQYEIERLIGRGGMGEVYLGHHAMLRRPTAIKLLRAENVRDTAAQSRFQREVKLTCQLNHPNTIEIFDYGRTPEGLFYYAMEYLDGFCVDALVKVGGPVAPGRVVHILLQACGSLREAHLQGFLHRDIKPSNMMMTNQGGVCDTLKILDFGLVRDLTADSEDGDEEFIAGTPKYLAPECIHSARSASPRSDIYALGAVAYYLLSGLPIFPGEDIADILAQQLEGDIPFPSERLGRALPQELEYVIMACLSRDPADRPADVEQLMVLLRQCQCPPWTAEDATQWWQTWGEAAIASGALSGEADASGFEVVMDGSRA